MQRAIAILCVLILPGAGTLAVAQTELPPPPQQQPQQSEPMLSPDQLDNLVAPIALYPDPLLGQVLAASTYPLEIVEAQQWLQQNRGLQGPQLVEAAKQQNWDPSVQALVAFPDAMAVLTRDIQWTTDLGNAFLAQQADVMNAVQTMRARAQQNGRLQSTPQETVTTQPDPQFNNGQGAIQIQPADPQTVYVPVYNPAYVWGPPVYGAYPPLYYPPVSYGCGVGVFLGALFSGFLSFGGWGWGLGWLTHGLFLNGLFFHHFGFSGFGGGFGERALWAHNPAHRLGVSYPNRAVAGRFGGFNERGYGARSFNERGFNGGRQASARSYSSGGESRGYNRAGGSSYERGNFQNRGYENNRSNSNSAASRYSSPAGNGFQNRGYENNRSYSNSAASRYSSPAGNSFQNRGYENNRSYSNSATNHYSSPRGNSAGNSFRAPEQNNRSFSAPRESSRGSSQHLSAPRGSGGGHASAPHSSSHSSHSSGKSGGSRKR